MSEEMRKCSKCGVEKNLEEFNKDKRKKGGRNYSCKKCDLEQRKAGLVNKVIRVEKYCPRCKVVLPIDKFGISSHRKDGHDDYCKKCRVQVVVESRVRVKNG